MERHNASAHENKAKPVSSKPSLNWFGKPLVETVSWPSHEASCVRFVAAPARCITITIVCGKLLAPLVAIRRAGAMGLTCM